MRFLLNPSAKYYYLSLQMKNFRLQRRCMVFKLKVPRTDEGKVEDESVLHGK